MGQCTVLRRLDHVNWRGGSKYPCSCTLRRSARCGAHGCVRWRLGPSVRLMRSLSAIAYPTKRCDSSGWIPSE